MTYGDMEVLLKERYCRATREVQIGDYERAIYVNRASYVVCCFTKRLRYWADSFQRSA